MSEIKQPERGEYWVNYKHQNVYRVFGLGSEATNERAGLQVVVYFDSDKAIYTREVIEFKQKFRPETPKEFEDRTGIPFFKARTIPW